MVSGSDLVVGLDHLPVVYSDVGDQQAEWLEPAVEYWEDSETLALRAGSGPEDWPRAAADDEEVPKIAVDAAQVIFTRRSDRSISFTVDKVGVPVLVRTSYFPNWSVHGADGPYRVTPNLMVVVPTQAEVELTYGRSGIELISMGLTLAALATAVFVARRPEGELDDAWWDLGREPSLVDSSDIVDNALSWDRIAPEGLFGFEAVALDGPGAVRTPLDSDGFVPGRRPTRFALVAAIATTVDVGIVLLLGDVTGRFPRRPDRVARGGPRVAAAPRAGDSPR